MSFHTGSFDGIGVLNTVTVVETRALDDALEIAHAGVDALDAACSRFRDDSELALLNRAGRGIVSPLLRDALEAALGAAAATDGLVDPTVGASMRALGYDRDFDVVVRRGAQPAFEARPAAGWRSVSVDPATSLVELRRGTELDLGATAKSFASDRIATAIATATGSAALVSLGGDIAVAGPAPEEGWPILVGDDSRARDGHGQVVAIRGGGLATSSTTVRRWRAGAAEVHHIVHPLTGAPASEIWRTVSVAAPTCLDANTAATAAVVLGESAVPWLQARGLAARLVRAGGEVVVTGGWPREER
jgi:thiamine biosynthesis lipoprotein